MGGGCDGPGAESRGISEPISYSVRGVAVHRTAATAAVVRLDDMNAVRFRAASVYGVYSGRRYRLVGAPRDRVSRRYMQGRAG